MCVHSAKCTECVARHIVEEVSLHGTCVCAFWSILVGLFVIQYVLKLNIIVSPLFLDWFPIIGRWTHRAFKLKNQGANRQPRQKTRRIV